MEQHGSVILAPAGLMKKMVAGFMRNLKGLN
jgi:hypothetical protein